MSQATTQTRNRAIAQIEPAPRPSWFVRLWRRLSPLAEDQGAAASGWEVSSRGLGRRTYRDPRWDRRAAELGVTRTEVGGDRHRRRPVRFGANR